MNNTELGQLTQIRRQYPLSFEEFFVADFYFCFIFSDDLRPKSINVLKDLFAPTVPQIEFSNNYKTVQQLK